MNTSGPIPVDLTPEERYVLARGLAEWGGPASPTDELALAMGFGSSEDLWRGKGRELREALRRGEHLTREDWRRTLLATEIVFASDVVGAGLDWSITTGLADEKSVRMLRTIQRKIGRSIPASVSTMCGREREPPRGPCATCKSNGAGHQCDPAPDPRRMIRVHEPVTLHSGISELSRS